MGEYIPTTKRPSQLRREAAGDKDDKPPAKKPTSWLNRLHRFYNWIIVSIISLLLIPMVVGVVAYYHFTQDLPSLDSLRNYRPKTVSYIFSDDGRILGEYYEEYRIVVPLAKIPDTLVQAFVATEDANFFNHPGVDLVGIIRAFLSNALAGRIVQGGSTITQQVTRTFLLSREKSYRRKIREAILAYRMEQNLTKEEILYLYLNQIYFGHGAYGVEAAAQIYFGKHVSQLSLGEAAMIAGLAHAPSRYSPYRHPETLEKRRRYVIERMEKVGFITPEQAKLASEETLVFREKYADHEPLAPYFTEHVRRRLMGMLGRDRLYQDGIRVFTTVDPNMQAEARKAIAKGLEDLSLRQGYAGPLRRLTPNEMEAYRKAQSGAPVTLTAGCKVKGLIVQVDKDGLDITTGGIRGRIAKEDLVWALRNRKISRVFLPGDVVLMRALQPDKNGLWNFSLEKNQDVQAALVCQETATGCIRAMVGGRDYSESQFNRAVQAHRQPGSSFKPFVYATAIDAGFSPADIIFDEPVEYEDQGKVWRPQNYGRSFHGPTTLYTGLVKSRNVVAVRLLEKIGIKKVVSQAKKMGITSQLAPYLSLALGSSEVTLLEMVSAYSTFPNLGERARPLFINRIEDRDGHVIRRFRPTRDRALSPDTAYVVLDMLKGVVERGTGQRVAALKRPVAGKTGTTNDQADAWFIGFTPDYVTGVWVGKDQRERLGRGENGGRTAGPVFLEYMRNILKDQPIKEFNVPPGVVFAEMDQETGDLAEEYIENPVKVCFLSNRVGKTDNSEYDPEWDYAGDEEYQPPTEHVRLIYRNGRFYKVVEPHVPRVRPDLPALPHPSEGAGQPMETTQPYVETTQPYQEYTGEFNRGSDQSLDTGF